MRAPPLAMRRRARTRVRPLPSRGHGILILGGDGYSAGRPPCASRRRGHEVSVVDNFSRRRWHTQHSTDSLTPIGSLADRIEAWNEVSGREIQTFVGSIEDGEFLDRVIAETMPEAIVHYGEQPSAPYSMKSRAPRGRDAVDERDRHAQPAVLDPRPGPRLPPRQARDDGRVRHPQHRHRGGVHRDRAQGAQGHAAVPEDARARSTTSPRSTTRTTSTSPAASGACARPTSTRASSTGSRPRSRPRDERLITRFDYDEYLRHRAQPLLRAGGDRPPAHRLRQRAARPAASSTSATRSSASSWRSATRASSASSASSTSSPSSSRSPSWPSWSSEAAASSGYEVEVKQLPEPAHRGRAPLLQRREHEASSTSACKPHSSG